MSITVTDSADDAGTLELWPVYDAVFGDQPDLGTWRSAVWDRHVARPGFRLARAHHSSDLVGFAYGYTGERGQWWSDRAADLLPPHVADEWIGGHFELVSIGVLPGAARRPGDHGSSRVSAVARCHWVTLAYRTQTATPAPSRSRTADLPSTAHGWAAPRSR